MGPMGAVVGRSTPEPADGRVDDDYVALFRSVYPRLVVGLSILGEAEGAEDAVQDAFVQALHHWDRVRTYDDPSGWVRRVALNRQANQRRSRRRRDRAVQRLSELPPGVDEPDAASMLDLRAALADLPERERTAVVLHHVVGVPLADIALDLDLPVGTVKSIVSRSRSRLRHRLGDAAPTADLPTGTDPAGSDHA